MDIFEVTSQKSWAQLSEQELGQLAEMGIDEHQFTMLKDNWSEFAQQPYLEPNPEMKQHLDQAFTTKYGESTRRFAGYWKWVAAAVGLLVIGVGVSVWNGPELETQLAQLEESEQEVESIVSADSVVKSEGNVPQKVSKSEVPQAIIGDQREPRNLGMENPSDKEIASSEVAMIAAMERVEDSKVATPQAKRAAVISDKVTQINDDLAKAEDAEQLRAMSFNSTMGSIEAYRKMKKEEEVIVVQESTVIKAVKLSELNLKSKSLLNLY